MSTDASINELTTKIENIKIDDTKTKINNNGTGAGGANTTKLGKRFENITDNEIKLLNDGYVKCSFTKRKFEYYLTKKFENKNIIFVLQNGLKTYMKNKYNIDVFRHPDEAYIIEYETGKKIIYILEKKEQNVEGTVELKLWSSIALKREYELVLGDDFIVNYALCLNTFLQKKMISDKPKYIILNAILNENNIPILFGNDKNYFETLNKWLNNSL